MFEITTSKAHPLDLLDGKLPAIFCGNLSEHFIPYRLKETELTYKSRVGVTDDDVKRCLPRLPPVAVKGADGVPPTTLKLIALNSKYRRTLGKDFNRRLYGASYGYWIENWFPKEVRACLLSSPRTMTYSHDKVEFAHKNIHHLVRMRLSGNTNLIPFEFLKDSVSRSRSVIIGDFDSFVHELKGASFARNLTICRMLDAGYKFHLSRNQAKILLETQLDRISIFSAAETWRDGIDLQIAVVSALMTEGVRASYPNPANLHHVAQVIERSAREFGIYYSEDMTLADILDAASGATQIIMAFDALTPNNHGGPFGPAYFTEIASEEIHRLSSTLSRRVLSHRPFRHKPFLSSHLAGNG
jgi:hypothetical protein